MHVGVKKVADSAQREQKQEEVADQLSCGIVDISRLVKAFLDNLEKSLQSLRSEMFNANNSQKPSEQPEQQSYTPPTPIPGG